jgi:Raf kinase inhibitor-like YbhB/YbcL family protein
MVWRSPFVRLGLVGGPVGLALLMGGTLVASDGQSAKSTGSFSLASPAFADGGEVPVAHTCEGEDRSYGLEWSGLPEGTRSLALIVDDPDAPDPAAPRMTWVHWVLYDIPVSATGLAEAVSPDSLPAGTGQGLNDWKRTGYGGPCPPIGRHRYFNKLYALDVVLGDLGNPDKALLEQSMEGHVLGQAVLVGTYQKRR